MSTSGYTSKMVLCLILGFGILVLSIGMLRGEQSISQYFELRKSQKILEATIQDLKNDNEQLSLEITKIKQSASYAQRVLRDKYHVTDKDEHIIFFAD